MQINYFYLSVSIAFGLAIGMLLDDTIKSLIIYYLRKAQRKEQLVKQQAFEDMLRKSLSKDELAQVGIGEETIN